MDTNNGNWLFPAIVSCLTWGLWGLFPKLASKYIEGWSIFIFATIGNILVVLSLVLLFKYNFISGDVSFDSKGIILAILGGIAGSIGSVFYNIAASRGRISFVVTLTGLYPIVTVILAYFLLDESLRPKDFIAIVLATIAIGLISL